MRWRFIGWVVGVAILACLAAGDAAGLTACPKGAHYSAAKGAVISWTWSISGEWGRHGIRCTTVVPAIWTAMYDERRVRMMPEQPVAHDLQMKAVIPLGGTPGDPVLDLAPPMVFPAGDGSRFINGQIIAVSGGLNTVS